MKSKRRNSPDPALDATDTCQTTLDETSRKLDGLHKSLLENSRKLDAIIKRLEVPYKPSARPVKE